MKWIDKEECNVLFRSDIRVGASDDGDCADRWLSAEERYDIIVATSDTKIYNLRGKVVSVDATTDFVTVDHEAIPGFMDAMTMSYKLKDANVTAKLHPGDHITAKVLAGNDDSDVQLDEVVITAQQISDHKSVTK